jgi:hypothetical protein
MGATKRVDAHTVIRSGTKTYTVVKSQDARGLKKSDFEKALKKSASAKSSKS